MRAAKQRDSTRCLGGTPTPGAMASQQLVLSSKSVSRHLSYSVSGIGLIHDLRAQRPNAQPRAEREPTRKVTQRPGRRHNGLTFSRKPRDQPVANRLAVARALTNDPPCRPHVGIGAKLHLLST